jgi:hypothetical protein
MRNSIFTIHKAFIMYLKTRSPMCPNISANFGAGWLGSFQILGKADVNTTHKIM